MNQLPSIPALGLTLAIPREKAEAALAERIERGIELVAHKVETEESMADLKRRNWQWVLDTCTVLKEIFHSDTVSLYFSSAVYVEVSVKLNDLERDLDEFPSIVRGRVERLKGLHKSLMVIPEPPSGDFIAAQYHPRIYAKTWRAFELAQYGSAVAAAVQEIEDAVKEAVSGNIQESGADLMRAAFEPEAGLLRDPEVRLIENQGMSDMFAGFIQCYKGLPSNCVFQLDQTARILAMASALMYQIDARKPRIETEPVEFELLKDEI